MTCNLCHPLCQCGAEAALLRAYRERVQAFLRARSPEVRAIESLLASYAVAA